MGKPGFSLLWPGREVSPRWRNRDTTLGRRPAFRGREGAGQGLADRLRGVGGRLFRGVAVLWFASHACASAGAGAGAASFVLG